MPDKSQVKNVPVVPPQVYYNNAAMWAASSSDIAYQFV